MEKNMNNLERYEIVKAGGWSLAEAGRARFVMDYIQSNPDIHYFVPSAPGVINEGDDKVTDLLIGCSPEGGKDQEFNKVLRGIRTKYGSVNEIFDEVRRRFICLGKDLGFNGFSPLLDKVEFLIISANRSDDEKEREKFRRLIPSRGEWLNGFMWSDLLGFRLIDPTELIRFRNDGRLDERSYSLIRSKLRGRERFVIPGFYGLGADGEVQLFPRDGSDVTGAVIAYGTNASVYRNLTNANGVFSADPDIVSCVEPIPVMTFKEYRELGNGGFKVLHRDAVIPCARGGIDINVRYSEEPRSPGTMIVATRDRIAGEGSIGIAGKAGFASLHVHKLGMEEDQGIAESILRTIRKNGISISYISTNTDDMWVFFSEQQLTENQDDRIMEELKRSIRSIEVVFDRNIGILSVVGQGLREIGSEVAVRLGAALKKESISHGITYVNQSIVVRAILDDSSRLKEAIQVAHKTLIEKIKPSV